MRVSIYIDVYMAFCKLMEGAAQALTVDAILRGVLRTIVATDIWDGAEFLGECISIFLTHCDNDCAAAHLVVVINRMSDEESNTLDLRAAVDAFYKGAVDRDTLVVVGFWVAFVVACGVFASIAATVDESSCARKASAVSVFWSIFIGFSGFEF